MWAEGAAARVKLFPSLPYIGPFAVFLALLIVSRTVPLPAPAAQAAFVMVMLLVLAVIAWPAPDLHDNFQVRYWGATLLIGVAVFVVWIAPDLLFPGYRHHWLFENTLTGYSEVGTNGSAQRPPAVIWLRAFRASAIVPVVEELFWRAWLMRWIVAPEFLKVPLGTWSARAFWIVAILFASEHGSFWAVGLAAGVVYNWWMIRTKSLADVMLAHAVTNACLSVYVALAGKWEYWS